MRQILLAGAALAPAILGWTAAQAQTQEAVKLEEVVVTGNRTPTPITEVPQTVSVVTRAEMDLRGVQDLNQALSYSAGIRFRDYPGQQGMQEFFMRGFRVNNTAGSVFRDGLRAQFNGLDGDIETFGVERVELLKGPASVLYGQAAPGGLVNVFTKRPTSDFTGELQAQLGSFDRRQVAADVGGPIDGDGKYLYRLTGLYRDSGTQFDHVDDDREYLAPAFTWRPTDSTDLTLLAQYQISRGSGSDQSFPTSGTIYANPNGQISSSRFLGDPAANRYRVETHNIGYELKQDLSHGLTFGQTLRYTESDLSYLGVNVASSAALVANRSVNRLALDRKAKSQSWLTDAHMAWKTEIGDAETTLLAGVDYSWWRRGNVQRNGSIGTLDVFAPVYGQKITWAATLASNLYQGLEQTGVYMQDQLKWRGLSVTGGLRQDWVETQTLNRLNNASAPLKVAKVTGRLGAIYEFDNGLAPYASYSTSFQPLAGSTFAGTPFKPTQGRQYEAGVKYAPKPGVLVSMSVYDIVQQNINTPDPAHAGFFVQQGEVESKGLELQGDATVLGTNVNLAYAYTDAKVTKANPNAAGVTQLGLKQLAVPANTVSLFLNREFPVGPGTLNVGGGARNVAGSFNSDNSVKTSGYTLVDGLLEYKIAKWDVALNVNNLFDKKYFTPGFYAQSVFFGYRRNVMATLRYRW
ncbi:TonB-dependent siderophore receptor [Phenylobacterium aquaticum]|uniref:TonB-dependent siderophore receptor n=1 Tax=Phenylobacterium aquaticum TaxID=1763816 RepID=UPI001F5D9FC7|nr:TonB-dependent siderophore receptor [Phenylobacterium aquaticum]MCI3131187.1 TonB-dependent siderophore receptor [Phenylobacterium aquaticum]